MIGIPLAFAASSVVEWVVHKYLLHGLGRKRNSFFAYHWHEHHKAARENDMVDPSYERSPFGWNAQGKEALGLVSMGLALTPLLPVAPFFVMTGWYCLHRYWRIHKKAHEDPAWAREHLPWHVDHHLGRDQNQNWCVTNPWFDHVMDTRIPYGRLGYEVRLRAPRPAAA
jgi:hypothetical protein